MKRAFTLMQAIANENASLLISSINNYIKVFVIPSEFIRP